ncbi:Cholesterol oxidase [Cytospora mali]|uniref:Cholesterol oxidase n=1 Tax=Cytospora mali TaxID=578113 RepID=A0A194VIS7_CYTMA|nr:Cholesterol oxidase [Valsa mali]
MATTSQHASVSSQDKLMGSDSVYMHGGPVQQPPVPYVNGSSTNGTNSPASTPRNVSHVSDSKDDEEDYPRTSEIPFPRMSPRAGTWPSPSPSPQPVPGELNPEIQHMARDLRHASHQIPTYGLHEGDVGGPQGRAYAKISTYTDDKEIEHQFPRISKPVELLRRSYDCIVIGSGYGGGVAASRMARAGETVCVLERGREKWPGEYPNGSEEAINELHCSGTFAPGCFTEGLAVDGGDPTGMYHLIFGKGQNAIVGNGLGGTSLMNANVFLEANHDSLSMKTWPEEIRENPHCLDKYYEKAREVLEPKPYPSDWPKLPKLELLKKQAEYLGMADKFHHASQTTRFRNGPNSCGVEMKPSALTGQDATGLNDGSKTTTLVTYLADAWNWGAEMFCECEVRHIQKCNDARGGYNVFFAWHGRNRGHFKANLHGDLMWVHAKKAVFIGGGAIGTTEILLRSKQLGLSMSEQVGQNMSGNGDILAFGYNTDELVNGVGRPMPSPYNPVGPCITGIIDNREGHDNPLDGYVIEEGSIPKALAPFMQTMLDLMPGSNSSEETLMDQAHAKLARWGSRILGPYFKNGAIERTQVYLIMSHDSNQAVLSLKDDKPELEFLGVGRSDHVKKLNNILAKATEAVGGTLVQNPFFALMGQQQVTVHPIGGACMARDGTPMTGVTNHLGEVFVAKDSDSDETHEGLIVMDGAVIPAALGANPFATITALAERSVEAYCFKHGLEINHERNEILDLFGEPKHHPMRRRSKTMAEVALQRSEIDSVNGAAHVISKADAINASGFGFTEVMSGFIHHHEEGMKQDTRATYELAYRTAKSLCESARFFLSVQAFNTTYIVRDPQHRGMLTGTFVCPTIPGSPFMVQRGEFNLFKLDHKAPGTRNLTYDFDMTGVNGELLHFHGYKVVDSSVALAPLQFWRSTSTLYVTISKRVNEGPISDDHDEDAWRRLQVVAKGMMHIQPSDFLSEIMTLTPTGSSIFSKIQSAASFMTYFTRRSLSLFLAPLTSLQYPSITYSGYINNTLPDQSFNIWASDRVCTKMHMWNPTHVPKGQKVHDLFMIPGASVDHQIFALPTIPYNAVNYFTRAGYRVFVTVHRIGQLMVAENNWTTYDARLDIRACLEYIRKMHKDDYAKKNKLASDSAELKKFKPPKTYTIAHCMGSVAFSSGLLDGTIPSSWILGITCSQTFMNPIWNTMNMIKASVGPIPMDKLYSMVAGSWFSCSTSRNDSFVQRALNQLLRFVPDHRRELCNSASCHRISLTFGRCWNHNNLNEATHRQIDRFFGGVNMRLLSLLEKMGTKGHVMGNAPLREVLTTPENIERLRGLPFLLFVGGDNAVLSPEATEKTYEILCDTFGTRAGGRGVGVAGESAHDSAGVEYHRRVVPGYGHLDCWMGRNAWKDVYPMVREEVDRVCRGDRYRFREPNDKFKRMVDSGELLY